MRVERTAADDGVTLAWRERPGVGPDVLFVHGWMLSGLVWDDLLANLRAPNRLLIPDLRGTGRSGPSVTFGLQRYADDLLAVADAARADRFVLVGHSMGGSIAQRVAARAPERIAGIVLYCPVPASGLALPPDAHGLFRNSAQNRQMQGAILDAASLDLPPAARERLLDDAGTLTEACIQGAYDGWTGGFTDPLDGVRAPALVVATDDPFLPPAFLQQAVVDRLHGGRMAYLPGAGHYVPVERPHASAALLDAFLAGMARPG